MSTNTTLNVMSSNFANSDVTNAHVTFGHVDEKQELFYGRHEFVTTAPGLAIPCFIILFIATVIGTFGNILTLVVIATWKGQRTAESIFIVNLAISDLYVTTVADPMSIIAKLEGKEFFDRAPGLCRAIASMCTISCITSLMTIGLLSLNRYIYICFNEYYQGIFTPRKSICMCVSVYFVGGTLVALNAAEVGNHGFDFKSLECIWDRMATYPYTVAFSIALVWVPSIVIGVCYLKIYLYVRGHKKRMRQQNEGGNSSSLKSFQLARTLFVIYAVFITCWAPYALLIVLDSKNTYPHEVHVIITMFAHLHPSLNWIIYYFTNKKFAASYREILTRCRLCVRKNRRGNRGELSNTVTDGPSRHKAINKDGTVTPDSGVILSIQSTNV